MERDSRAACEVLVVGAGPVGLFTALGLSERGIHVRVVDKYRRSALHSYALGLHSGTQVLFDRYGLADTFADHGWRLDGAEVWLDGAKRGAIDYSAIGGSHPHVLVLPQSVLEAGLEKRLAENGVEVEWGCSMLAFEDDGGSVGVLLAETDDRDSRIEIATSRLRTSYVVGADGYDSITRRLLSVPCDDVGAPLTYGLVEFESEIELPHRATLLFGRQWTDVFWPLGAGRGRWGVQLGDDSGTRDVSDLLTLIRQRAPWFDIDASRVDWVSSIKFQPRLVQALGRERVWLAGDSAHLTEPAGVQSMNVGLREGHDLGRRLAKILRGNGSPNLLRYYHEERQREWKMLLGVHDRLQVLAGAPTWSRELGGRLVRSLPATKRNLNSLLEQVGLRLDWMRGKKARQAS